MNRIVKSEAVNLLKNADLSEKQLNIIKHKYLLSHMKMDKEIITFGNIVFEKHKFHPLLLKGGTRN